MKLPRWLLITLIACSLFAVLATGASCWLQWPEWTARAFLDHLANGEFEAARRLMSRESAIADCPADLWPGSLKRGAAQIEQTTMTERFAGRRRLTFVFHDAVARFTVQMGNATLDKRDDIWLEVLNDQNRAEIE